MRLGKVEKAVIKTLEICAGSAEWSWPGRYCDGEDLAEPENIERYERGEIVPVWMLNRDLPYHKAAISRALSTLEKKGIVCLHNFCLDGGLWLYGQRSQHAKYVSLNVNFEKLPFWVKIHRG